jgi:hypothetical protein
MLPLTPTPSGDDSVTILCPVCRCRRFIPSGRKRVCSPTCRQTAYRRRRAATTTATAAQVVVPAHRSRREGTIYQCPACETYYFGSQRCDACGVFCRRVGPGGLCPHCSEPVAVAELIDSVAGSA